MKSLYIGLSSIFVLIVQGSPNPLDELNVNINIDDKKVEREAKENFQVNNEYGDYGQFIPPFRRHQNSQQWPGPPMRRKQSGNSRHYRRSPRIKKESSYQKVPCRTEDQNDECLFPFEYPKGKTYNIYHTSCTKEDATKAWCYKKSEPTQWGYCDPNNPQCFLPYQVPPPPPSSRYSLNDHVSVSENVDVLSTERRERLKQAMRKLKHSRHWEKIASMHGEPKRPECNGAICCKHGDKVFLPWHRILLDEMNKALGMATMPYWDWTTSPFPELALSEPFSGGYIKFKKERSRRDRTGYMVPLNVVLKALQTSDFTTFSVALGGIHDGVHLRIGGSMNDLDTASYDPVFWMHHTFVDLIWAVYQYLHPNSLPHDDGHPLIPFGKTVAKTLKTNRYNLDINSDRIVLGGMTLQQIQNKIARKKYGDYGFSGVFKNDTYYAGFVKRSYNTSGFIKFNLCNLDDCSFYGGELPVLGSEHEQQFMNQDPTLVDITDSVKKAKIDKFKNVRFKVTSFEDTSGKKLPLRHIYQPIRVVEPGTQKIYTKDIYGTKGLTGYCIFFGKNYVQPPTLRIPKNIKFEIDSSSNKVKKTKNVNTYKNCQREKGETEDYIYSKSITSANHGDSYYFDDDCNTQSKDEEYVSKLHIVRTE